MLYSVYIHLTRKKPSRTFVDTEGEASRYHSTFDPFDLYPPPFVSPFFSFPARLRRRCSFDLKASRSDLLYTIIACMGVWPSYVMSNSTAIPTVRLILYSQVATLSLFFAGQTYMRMYVRMQRMGVFFVFQEYDLL